MEKSVMKQHGIDKNRLAKKMEKASKNNSNQSGMVILSDAEIKRRKIIIEEVLKKHNISLPKEPEIKSTDGFEEKMEQTTLFCYDTYKSIIKFWEIDIAALNQASSISKLEDLQNKFEKFVDDKDNHMVLKKNKKL